MKETKTTRNSLHADPNHRVAADRVDAECGGGDLHCTAGITQAAKWKYVEWLSITSQPHLTPAAKNHGTNTTHQMGEGVENGKDD